MPFLPPNQQRLSTEGTVSIPSWNKTLSSHDATGMLTGCHVCVQYRAKRLAGRIVSEMTDFILCRAGLVKPRLSQSAVFSAQNNDADRSHCKKMEVIGGTVGSGLHRKLILGSGVRIDKSRCDAVLILSQATLCLYCEYDFIIIIIIQSFGGLFLRQPG